jgi:hypothetical protein
MEPNFFKICYLFIIDGFMIYKNNKYMNFSYKMIFNYNFNKELLLQLFMIH